MLPAAKLYEALAVAENNGLFSYLDEIYSKVPEGRCPECSGACCDDPPPAGLIEYLNAYRFIRDNLDDGQKDLVEKAVRFYFLKLVDPAVKCPFLSAGKKCLIYPVRPLGCRLMGVLDKAAHTQLNSVKNEGTARYYREQHGIELPRAVVEAEIPYCEGAGPVAGNPVRLEEAQEMTMGVLAIDAKILPSRIVFDQAVFAPVATHLACSVLNEGVQRKKPEVMKEYLSEGRSVQMEKYLARVASFSF